LDAVTLQHRLTGLNFETPWLRQQPSMATPSRIVRFHVVPRWKGNKFTFTRNMNTIPAAGKWVLKILAVTKVTLDLLRHRTILALVW
jgi:hypothetical protein